MGGKQKNIYYGRKHRCERFQQCAREYSREKFYERMVVAAVECLACKKIVPTNTRARYLCDDCNRLMWADTPRWVLHDMVNQPSFERYPDKLLAWKRVIDYRKHKRENSIRKEEIVERLRR